ncbi:hypothetical protein HA052_18915 [Chromobacterium haemolyticum]|uniref:Integrase n=1 Tax=Chromobacterium fluminis TaxID=3044269 RepID=A0ABX0LJ67_9NEIS|nr:hypothetical protein [Chromobacterium haemolyticum]NHR07262.1 hypothetical protein [Chromobacterium haemolyticum]
MNGHYSTFIELGRRLAEDRGIQWDMPTDAKGAVAPESLWNLNKLIDDDHPPYMYLRNFGCDARALKALNEHRANLGATELESFVLSATWQNLIKAATTIQLFSKRNTVSHVAQNVIRPLRVIATCSQNKAPWALVNDDVRIAVQISKEAQASGKLGDQVAGIVKTVLDVYHLTEAGPLYPALADQRIKVGQTRKARFLKSEDELRHDLEDRKRSERLPERRAFWELIRIVMTEQPKSFIDELRFIGIKTLITTGFRVGEASLLPLDWERRREYCDRAGQPAGSQGGISSSLMIRHFAEKQQAAESDSHILVEATQYVPQMFEELLVELLNRAAELTSPLRETLRLQVETGRLLPWFRSDEVVPVIRLYPYLTGNPFWLELDKELRTEWTNRYKGGFNSAVLHELQLFQEQKYRDLPGNLSNATYLFFNRLGLITETNDHTIVYRRADGSAIPVDARMRWSENCLHVGELEAYIRARTPSKVSDMAPFNMENGVLQPWELLLLNPKRSLAEERNGSICDVTRYMSINVPDSNLIGDALGVRTSSNSLFAKYGETEQDRGLTMTPHMLRHLQNAELFRLGVADTIISKRFNRRSVAQSYEYDHRSLAEELEQVEIPEDIEFALGEKATTVAKMISLGKAHGPIVDSFKRIQAAEGDAAAFEYLKAEADGFHATPYGHCLNSFTVDPCSKHLECFSGCRHLSATNLPEQRAALIRLEGKLSSALELAQARPSKSIGRKNQIAHATDRLQGVRKILSAQSGEHPFPDGPDLSKTNKSGVMDA